MRRHQSTEIELSMEKAESLAEEIKSRCDIVDVIGRVVPLKKTGANLKGPCPFHKEADPSFVVSEAKQIFTCFGCGATGDVIGFVEKYYQMDFIQAAEKLADEYGIDIKSYLRPEKNRREKDETYEMNREAAKFFFTALRTGKNRCLDYIAVRGISHKILNKFGIGYADEQWRSLYDYLTAKGFDEKKLFDAGLLSRSKGRYYDKFRDRLIFPIINTRGKVIGFGGRAIGDDEPKYLNSPETSVFSKKHNLYGLNITRSYIQKSDRAILVEGYMDTISLYQYGVRNVAASLGTSLTENQAGLIKRYSPNVVLSYDGDTAGQNAAVRGSEVLYKCGCKPRILRISKGKDPDDFIREMGKPAFMELVDNALPFVDRRLCDMKRNFDINSTAGRIDYIKEATKILALLSPVEQDIYIKKISGDMKISEITLERELRQADHTKDKRASVFEHETDRHRRSELSGIEKNLLKLMISEKKYFSEFDNSGDVFGAVGKDIYSAIAEQYADKDGMDVNRMLDCLDYESAAAAEDMLSNIRVEEAEEAVFTECMTSLEQERYIKRQKKIMLKLSVAEEEKEHEEVKKILEEINEIQKKIKKQEVSTHGREKGRGQEDGNKEKQ